MGKQEYQVEVQVSETHVYTVEANTPEEEEVIAEQWYEEGEEGNTISIDDMRSEAVPTEAEAE